MAETKHLRAILAVSKRGLSSLYCKVKESDQVPLPRAQGNVSGTPDATGPLRLGKASKLFLEEKLGLVDWN